jgi:pyridoxal phosphate enzyme (YggS family)
VSRSEELARNLAIVRERVRRAERAAGRPEGSVRLVAVSKTMPAEDVVAALGAGQRDFGENYAQELRDKRDAVAAAPGGGEARWHFIGPLQSNKVKYLAGKVALLHTLDTPELLEEVHRRLLAAGPQAPVQECLVQVNVAAEPQKRGIAPAALPALLDRFAELPRLRCVGLMLIPPLGDDPEVGRPHFAALRRLRDEQMRRSHAQVALTELSMGMSHDLEVAIDEGATLVRVGTAIFGARASKR